MMFPLLNHSYIKLETWITIAFIITSTYVTALKPYALLILIYICFLYFASRNFIKTIWIAFIVVDLMFHAKYFSEPVVFKTGYFEHHGMAAITTYYVAFSDAILLGLIYLLKRRERLSPSSPRPHIHHSIIISMLLIIVIGIISTWQSSYFAPSAFYLLVLTKYFIYFLCTFICVSNKSIFITTLQSILAYIILNAILVVMQYINNGLLGLPIEQLNQFIPFGAYADESNSTYRPGGIHSSPNLFASIFAMTIPLLLALPAKEYFHSSIVKISSFFIILLAMICTSSRAAWLTTMFNSLIFYHNLATSTKRNIFLRLRNPKVVIAGISLILIILPHIATRVVSTFTSVNALDGLKYRWHHLQIGYDFMRSKLFGVGLNVYQYEMVNHYDANYIYNDSTPAHNALAEIMGDLGIFGLIFSIYLFYQLLFKTTPFLVTSSYRNISQGLFLSMISYICIIQLHPWFFERPVSDLFWIIGGMHHALPHLVKNS